MKYRMFEGLNAIGTLVDKDSATFMEDIRNSAFEYCMRFRDTEGIENIRLFSKIVSIPEVSSKCGSVWGTAVWEAVHKETFEKIIADFKEKKVAYITRVVFGKDLNWINVSDVDGNDISMAWYMLSNFHATFSFVEKFKRNEKTLCMMQYGRDWKDMLNSECLITMGFIPEEKEYITIKENVKSDRL